MVIGTSHQSRGEHSIGRAFAVTGIPDEKKGEKLIVLYSINEQEIEKIYFDLSSDIPNLWKSRKEHFLKVDDLRYLGTGKLDLKGIKRKN